LGVLDLIILIYRIKRLNNAPLAQLEFCVTAYGGIKGENCMKNWKHWAFVAIIAIFPIIVLGLWLVIKM
jgi:hypothetical protein